MYLVLVSCFSFGEGKGKKVEYHDLESSRKNVRLKARDLKYITRLHAELQCSSARKDDGVKIAKSYLTFHGIAS